jgi:hypothetical protein
VLPPSPPVYFSATIPIQSRSSHTYLWDCRGKKKSSTTNYTLKIVNSMSVNSSKTKKKMTKIGCGHNIMSVTHKVSDHHCPTLHHEKKSQWRASALSPHWLHQLSTMTVTLGVR